MQNDVCLTLKQTELKKLTLLSKWGCDGSSGHSLYKQKFEEDQDSDAHIFLTSFVPLELISGDLNSPNKVVIWKNARPGSSRYCRPIRLQFIHETSDITLKEKKYIEDQIEALKPSAVNFHGKQMYIDHHLLFTMIDGKICNAATSTTSTQKCYLCGATSKLFNNIDLMVQREVDTTAFSFGLSTLHAWIRFFECLLHMSYKLPIKTWQARGEINKNIVSDTKKRIQDDFRTKLGLLVDRPKPGFGSTNDGNTARRFFQNVEIASSITGIDKQLIHRFKVILQTIASGHFIDTKKFKKYALETARMFTDKYPWYNMPPTVHKILIHGPDIIDSFMVPIGQLTEEAQEAINKEIKRCREGFARKCSRQKTLEDVFNRLLIASDPVISSHRRLPKRKSKSFEREVIDFLLPPETEVSSTDTSDTSEKASSDEETEEESD